MTAKILKLCSSTKPGEPIATTMPVRKQIVARHFEPYKGCCESPIGRSEEAIKECPRLVRTGGIIQKTAVKLLSKLVFRTKNIHNLVDVLFLHILASGTEILAGVELCGVCCKHLTNSSCHSQTAVAVDVDFANCE